MRRLFLLATTLCLLSLPALADEVEPFAEIVSPADSLPHLRYLADGKITINDRCPVRKVALNPNMGASYVNGEPVGFC